MLNSDLLDLLESDSVDKSNLQSGPQWRSVAYKETSFKSKASKVFSTSLFNISLIYSWDSNNFYLVYVSCSGRYLKLSGISGGS